MTFDTEEALLIAMGDALPELVENYVKPRAEGLLRRNINTRVYRSYTPTEYVRRWSLLNNIYSEITKTGGYSVDYDVTSTANTKPLSKNSGWTYYRGGFLYMLENGDMGFWRKGFPRPSIEPTQSEFDRGYLSSAIRTGIKSVF